MFLGTLIYLSVVAWYLFDNEPPSRPTPRDEDDYPPDYWLEH